MLSVRVNHLYPTLMFSLWKSSEHYKTVAFKNITEKKRSFKRAKYNDVTYTSRYVNTFIKSKRPIRPTSKYNLI